MHGFAVVANIEPVVAGQPRYRALYHPPVTAETFGGLDTFAGNPYADTSMADPSAQLGNIVCLVRVLFSRLAPPRPASRPHGRDRLHKGFERL